MIPHKVGQNGNLMMSTVLSEENFEIEVHNRNWIRARVRIRVRVWLEELADSCCEVHWCVN